MESAMIQIKSLSKSFKAEQVLINITHDFNRGRFMELWETTVPGNPFFLNASADFCCLRKARYGLVANGLARRWIFPIQQEL